MSDILKMYIIARRKYMDQLLDRNAKNFIRPDLKTYCEQNIIRLYEEKYQSIYKDNYNFFIMQIS